MVYLPSSPKSQRLSHRGPGRSHQLHAAGVSLCGMVFRELWSSVSSHYDPLSGAPVQLDSWDVGTHPSWKILEI